MDVEDSLSRAFAQETVEGKAAGLVRVIDECVAAGDGLESVVTRVVSEDVRSARTLMVAMAQRLREHLKTAGEVVAEGMHAALKGMASQQAAFEEADALIRQSLFDHYVSEGSFADAARTLAGFHVDRKSEAEKASLYVKIAETFLEDDMSVEAEGFVNRASGLMHFVSTDDWALQLRYRVTLARTLDARRKFLEAAVSYYDLSQARHEEISTDDLVALLAKAVTCALLGPAGPQRTRILSTLYKDERVNAVMAPSTDYASHATVLQKMCTGQLVNPKTDVAAFEATLLPHHKALLPDGLTIPERATIQHNMVALSHVYDNVFFTEVGTLLAIDPAKAMQVAARMISDGRLDATIDQVNASLIFTTANASNLHTANFDRDIALLCNEVNACYDKIDAILEKNSQEQQPPGSSE